MQQVTGIWIASFSTKSMAKRAFRRYMQTALTGPKEIVARGQIYKDPCKDNSFYTLYCYAVYLNAAECLPGDYAVIQEWRLGNADTYPSFEYFQKVAREEQGKLKQDLQSIIGQDVYWDRDQTVLFRVERFDFPDGPIYFRKRIA